MESVQDLPAAFAYRESNEQGKYAPSVVKSFLFIAVLGHRFQSHNLKDRIASGQPGFYISYHKQHRCLDKTDSFQFLTAFNFFFTWFFHAMYIKLCFLLQGKLFKIAQCLTKTNSFCDKDGSETVSGDGQGGKI